MGGHAGSPGSVQEVGRPGEALPCPPRLPLFTLHPVISQRPSMNRFSIKGNERSQVQKMSLESCACWKRKHRSENARGTPVLALQEGAR